MENTFARVVLGDQSMIEVIGASSVSRPSLPQAVHASPQETTPLDAIAAGASARLAVRVPVYSGSNHAYGRSLVQHS